MLKVIVNRKTWYRGQGGPGSRLLLEDGRRCCVGFLAKRLGASDETLLEECDLLALTPCKQTDSFSNSYDDTLNRAYNVNDNNKLTEEDREATLKDIGKKMGVQFIFRG